jgi:KUP system potassium uptake protein
MILLVIGWLIMKENQALFDINKLTFAGAIITIGIVFGDLGTSPLYAMRALISEGAVLYDKLLIYGGISCIFWTLTISTTIKYIIIALRNDNNGEGGIFSLFALLKEKTSLVAVATMIGAAALLADAVLTPSITVTSSIEGLRLYNPNIGVVPIVLVILSFLFFFQKYGTNIIGKLFGPVMIVWLIIISVLGMAQLIKYPAIFEALSPIYAYRFLTEYPGGFLLLSSVFLAITGAETIYADLGHCGRKNIQFTWIFVKVALVLNYFGQGAWLMMNMDKGPYVNPFFSLMPEWFLVPGVVLATATAIIASQAIITGSFTLVSEAISLNFWPKMKVMHPTFIRGQVYLPIVNGFLWIACCVVVLSFKESVNMGAAYGLAINISELVTTILLSHYLLKKGVNHRLVLLLFSVFFLIEFSFLIANLHKFSAGGWITLFLASIYMLVMVGWYFGRKIKNRYITFVDLDEYLDAFRDIIKDKTIPRYATNLVYIIRANRMDQVESKVIYSIFKKQPKRADTYWLLHVDRVNDPNSFDYQVNQIIPGVLIRIDFHIGFKVDPKIHLFFKDVIEDLVNSGEIELKSSYNTLRKHNVEADFKFVLNERIMSRDSKLSSWEDTVLVLNRMVRKLSLSDEKTLNLDPSNTITEQVPIILDQPEESRIGRIT